MVYREKRMVRQKQSKRKAETGNAVDRSLVSRFLSHSNAMICTSSADPYFFHLGRYKHASALLMLTLAHPHPHTHKPRPSTQSSHTKGSSLWR